ncbi:MAG: lanthionine synthetase C family protein [Anaerolineae bacterium]
MSHSTHWRPLLDGPEAATADHIVREIAEALRHPAPALMYDERSGIQFSSLGARDPWIALLLCYLADAHPNEGYEEAAAALFEQAVDALATTTMGPALHDGIAGVAWSAAHLEGRLFEPDETGATEAVDLALSKLVCQGPWLGHYDLISGLVGFGVYFLERLPLETAARNLECVVERLGELAEHRSSGVTWRTPPELLPASQRELYPRGYYNLGVAHGVPGVVALLGEVCEANIAVARARPLLDGAVEWLMKQGRPAEATSWFPPWVAPGAEPGPARLGWCYGDLGIAAALLSAARRLNERRWEQYALELAHATARRRATDTTVKDACLCHGAAGVGHLFNRLFQATGAPGLKEAALYWYERSFTYRKIGGGIAGYRTHRPGAGAGGAWVEDPGFLTGAAGVALAQLAATCCTEPDWDRLLLASIPPGRPSA